MRTKSTSRAMPGALCLFQDAFDCALLAPDAAPDAEVTALIAQPAFAVYRNTGRNACIDALWANYPTVVRLVGEQWFRAAASAYVSESLPADPSLMRYGAGFAGFLAGFEPAADLPYLPHVARLDRFWTEAHIARNDCVLDPARIANLAPDTLAPVVLRLHASARWAWFPNMPVYSIWSRNRSSAPVDDDLDWKAEGALIVRPRATVEWTAIDAAACAFLEACARGRTIQEAANAALEVRHDADLVPLISSLLGAGAFSRLLHHSGYSARRP